ncbi:PH domain-containing protein [Paraliobacillus ryukyuensis]|uniref:PH domain-containing protein n=1 Tax=Paraliobacillus ryukyuensis TaxID=200904 RepID=UPI0009A80F5D|nr:PH domain-containing protein [Paraliobacillus ryukyuensis]
MMSEAKRLHPVSILFHVITTTRQIFFALLPIILLAINDFKWLHLILGLIIVIVFLLGFSILKWLRFTYQIEQDQLRIDQGVFVRQKRTISKHRIQSIDLTQNVIHRIFGLTKVQIETAGSNLNVDASLSAVTFAEGKWLHDQLKYHNNNTPVDTEDNQVDQQVEKQYPTRQISWKMLILAGSTSGSFGILLALIGFASSEAESLIPDSFYKETTSWIFSQAIPTLILLSIILLIGIYIVGILSTLIKYGNFTITRYEEELYITRGLLEKKQMTIPLKRIQVVGIKQSIIREPLGLATVFVEIAGGEVDEREGTETLLFPILFKKEIKPFLAEIIPEYNALPDKFQSIPKRALPYYFVRAAWLPIIASIIVALFWFKWIWVPLLILTISIIFGFLRFRTNGYDLTDKQLTLRLRHFSKDIIMLRRRRIQAFETQQHVLHRKQRLATTNSSILNNFAGRHYKLNEIESDGADEIGKWYSYQTKG